MEILNSFKIGKYEVCRALVTEHDIKTFIIKDDEYIPISPTLYVKFVSIRKINEQIENSIKYGKKYMHQMPEEEHPVFDELTELSMMIKNACDKLILDTKDKA